MTIHCVFGLNARDIDEAAMLVEAALGLKMQARESSYRSGDYFRSVQVEGEQAILQCNCDAFDGEWNEPEHQDMAYLLYVSQTHRPLDLERQLNASIPNSRLLRRVEV